MGTDINSYDWSEHFVNEHSDKPSKPLKRGDACLACRKRRIRCGAEKPACATCVRLHKECVYDSTQRPSRITKLKDRIAELEGQVERLKDPDDSPPVPLPTSFNSSFDFTAPFPSTSTTDFNIGSSNPITSHSLPTDHGIPLARSDPFVNVAQPPPSTSLMGSSRFQFISEMNQNGPSMATGVGSSDRIPNIVDQMLSAQASTTPWSVNHDPVYSQSSIPRPPQAPDPNFNYDFGLLDNTMMDLASSLDVTASFASMFAPSATSSVDTTSMRSDPLSQLAAPPPATETIGSSNTSSVISLSPFGEALKEPRKSKDRCMHLSGIDDSMPDVNDSWIDGEEREVSISSLHTFRPASHPAFAYANLQVVSAAEPEPSYGLLGGWFDPDDVPPSVRDHLLDLYFSKASTPSVFQSLINIPRFYTRLTLAPSKRPHQCLMYMMYLNGARASSNPALRALESTFYEIAQRKIRQGLKEADRLLDVVRALSLMVAYLFSKELYNLGYNTAGSAIRLAIACGLHKIPSGAFTPPVKFDPIVHFTLRTGAHALEQPEDAVELGERIQAFWAVYEVDQCTSVAYLWDPGFTVDNVTTPLPRPLEDYASGFVSAADDVRLVDVIHPVGYPSKPKHTDFHALRLKGLALLSEAVRLRDKMPEDLRVGQSEARLRVQPRFPNGIGVGNRSARESLPSAFADLRAALDRYVSELPPVYTAPWQHWERDMGDMSLGRTKLRKDTVVLWLIVGDAYIALWDVRSLSAENSEAVIVARRLAAIIATYDGEEMMGGYSAFIICIWNEVAMNLLRELKRLEVLDRLTEAKVIEADLDAVVASLEAWAHNQRTVAQESVDIAAINIRLLQQLRNTSKEEWAVAMKEADARFGRG